MYSQGGIVEETVREIHNSHAKVLVALPKADDRLKVKACLDEMGCDVTPVPDPDTLRALLRNRHFQLVVMLHDPDAGMNVLELLREVQHVQEEHRPGFIALASSPSVEDAVRAMRLGAMDFLCDPWEQEVLEYAVKRALCTPVPSPAPLSSSQCLKNTRPPEDPKYAIITRNPEMERILAQAGNVAASKATVLIQGESGTGKELLARFIHWHSDRAQGPFVALNCAALPETLLESELFGHEKGAFSGAIARKPGKFELADHGTLLLDEVTEMDLGLQAKLLRVLQEGEVDRLGATSPVKVDVRIVATTNRDIGEAVRSGKFREDLYFRLNVIPLRLPPLRERREDIGLLAEDFRVKYAREYGKDGLKFAKGVIEDLEYRTWRGNVRELKNVVERGVLLAQGDEITINDLFLDEAGQHGPEGISSGSETFSMMGTDNFSLSDVEKEMVKRALARTKGNRTHAAKLLGISVRTLRNKLAEYRQTGLVL